MNDLDLMQKFRADVPPPGPGVLDGARSAMFRAENTEKASRKRWVWGLIPVAALTAAVAVGVAVVAVRPQPAPVQTQALPGDAAQVLRLAAAEARREPALKARPDQFIYVESLVAYAWLREGSNKDGDFQPPVERPRRIWQSVDGSRTGLLRAEANPGESAEDTPRDSSTEAGFPAYRKDLPTDATAMRAFLYKDAENPKKIPVDRIAFTKVGDILREQYLPPAALAALFEAAATIPGTTKVEQADLAGRRGIAVSRVDQDFRHDLIFDAKTYKFLGERDVMVGDLKPYPKNAVTGWTAQLKVAVVDRAGQLP